MHLTFFEEEKYTAFWDMSKTFDIKYGIRDVLRENQTLFYLWIIFETMRSYTYLSEGYFPVKYRDDIYRIFIR